MIASKPHTEVVMSSIPHCDIHADREAMYDFKTDMGPWMYGCSDCFEDHGIGLGLGLGQRLILREPQDDTDTEGDSE